MCQAKITNHWSQRFKCMRPDTSEITMSVTYSYGHMKGKTRTIVRVLCTKHAHTFRYNAGVKARRGHYVKLIEIKL